MKKTRIFMMLALALPVVALGQTWVLPKDGNIDLKYYHVDYDGDIPDADSEGRIWSESDYDDSGWTDFGGELCQTELFYLFGTPDTPTLHNLFYRRSFNLTETDDHYYLVLSTHGVSLNLSVYINGYFMSNYQIGEDFYFLIPSSVLKVGNNVIAIKDVSRMDGYDDGHYTFGVLKNSKYMDIDGSTFTSLDATDVTQMSNAIYGDSVETFVGKEVNMQLKLKNVLDASNYQLNIRFPYMVHLIEATLAESRHDGHTLTINGMGDNKCSLVVFSSDGGEISGNDGAIINLKLVVDENRTEAIVPIIISNAVYTTADAQRISMPTVQIPMTLMYPEPGDSNFDEQVTVADIVAIINYIVSFGNDYFSWHGADANRDGSIDVSDAQWVLNKVLRRNTSRQVPGDMFDPQ